jgi:hypothetical protein
MAFHPKVARMMALPEGDETGETDLYPTTWSYIADIASFVDAGNSPEDVAAYAEYMEPYVAYNVTDSLDAEAAFDALATAVSSTESWNMCDSLCFTEIYVNGTASLKSAPPAGATPSGSGVSVSGFTMNHMPLPNSRSYFPCYDPLHATWYPPWVCTTIIKVAVSDVGLGGIASGSFLAVSRAVTLATLRSVFVGAAAAGSLGKALDMMVEHYL